MGDDAITHADDRILSCCLHYKYQLKRDVIFVTIDQNYQNKAIGNGMKSIFGKQITDIIALCMNGKVFNASGHVVVCFVFLCMAAYRTRTLKYLGVLFDGKLSYRYKAQMVSNKISAKTKSVNGLVLGEALNEFNRRAIVNQILIRTATYG